MTPADAYFGRTPAIIKQRERIKQKTIEALPSCLLQCEKGGMMLSSGRDFGCIAMP